MKILTIILKILILIATGVCGVVFNLFGSIAMLNMGMAQDKQLTEEMIFWLIFTIVCYIAPAFLVMLKKYIISAAMSFVGVICVLVLHEMLGGSGKELYLQLLIISILTITLGIIGSWDKIQHSMDKSYKKKTAAAPSVLGGTTQAIDAPKKTTSRKNKSKKK